MNYMKIITYGKKETVCSIFICENLYLLHKVQNRKRFVRPTKKSAMDRLILYV